MSLEEQLLRLTRKLAKLEVNMEKVLGGQADIAEALIHLLEKHPSPKHEMHVEPINPPVQNNVSEEEFREIGNWVIDQLGWDNAVEKMIHDGFSQPSDLESLNQSDGKSRALLLGNWLCSKHTIEQIRAKMVA